MGREKGYSQVSQVAKGSNTEGPDHNVEATLQRMQLSVAIFPRTYHRNSFDEAARAHCVQQVRSTWGVCKLSDASCKWTKTITINAITITITTTAATTNCQQVKTTMRKLRHLLAVTVGVAVGACYISKYIKTNIHIHICVTYAWVYILFYKSWLDD